MFFHFFFKVTATTEIYPYCPTLSLPVALPISSLGAAVYCIEESVRYARTRKPFGAALAKNQAIQFPLVELATQAEMLRLLIRKTAWDMDHMPHKEIEHRLSDKVRSEEHTSELQSLMRNSYAVFCLKKKT